MSVATGALAAPAPEVTAALAEAALSAFRQPVTTRYADVDALTRLGAEPVEGPLQRWAEQITTEQGLWLLGTGLRAPTYPALLWNGARLDAVASDVGWAPLLAGLARLEEAAAPHLADEPGRLTGALSAAEAVRHGVTRLLCGDGAPVAWPSVTTMAAATAAHLVLQPDGTGLARVLDLAASLTALTPGEARTPLSGVRTGHAAASGWLAARLPDGVTPMAGSVVHTRSAAAGAGTVKGQHRGSLGDVLARLR